MAPATPLLQQPHTSWRQPKLLLLPARSWQCHRVGLAGACPRAAARRRRQVAVFAQQPTGTDKKPRQQQPSSVSSEPQEQQLGEGKKWGLFDGKAYLQRWEVPWGGKELALGMVGWAVTFVAVGLAFIPVVRLLAGPEGLSQGDRVYITLANQVAETVVGVGVVRAVVERFRPFSADLLRIDLRGPFQRPTGWGFWAIGGVALSPLVVFLTSLAMDSIGYDGVSGRGTVDAVSSIIALDGPTYCALFATTAVLAPLLEETVFRGFLLATLTKWMPTPAAVLLSSIAFGCAHFTPRDFPQLTALGVLLGLSYVRSRNLLTPMIIHGAWNGTVLTVLFALTSAGVDIDALVHGQL